MKDIKMVAMDMDGTILNHDDEGLFISDVTKATIKKLKDSGVKVAIATGRSYGLLKDFITELGLEDDYHIMCNGAATLKPDGSFINLHGIPMDTYRTLVQRFTDRAIPFAVFDADLSYCLPYTMHAHAHAYRGSIIKEDLMEIPFITKFVVGPYDHKIIKEACDGQEISLALSVFQGVDYAEIWPLGLHKGTAVEDVAKLYGIALENVMAIGDGGNDTEMLAYVGWGVAMGNATDAVKSHADAVTADIIEEGLTQAIEKYVFNKDFS